MPIHLALMPADGAALRAGGAVSATDLLLCLDDDLARGPWPAELDAWAEGRAAPIGAPNERERARKHYAWVLAALRSGNVTTNDSGEFIIWAGPERAQQFLVAFMASVVPDELESGCVFHVAETPCAPALCQSAEIVAVHPRVIDDMHVRMAASVWRCICDNSPVAAAELATMIDDVLPALARAVRAWADEPIAGRAGC